jgi:4-hydroxy-tetrahydrodipicolinate synthase
MPVDFIVQVANEIPQIQYIKLEDPPTPTKITAIRQQIGDRLGIFGGLGGVFLLDELRRGSMGAMTGFAYPEILVDICDHMKNGDIVEAENMFYEYLPLIQYEQQEGIGLAVRKAGLLHRGFINSSTTRSPGPNITEDNVYELKELIRKVGLH